MGGEPGTEEKMRILVVGATGVLGRQVVPRLVERGHAVRAVVRRAEQGPVLEAAGAEVVQGDILDRDSLTAAAADCEAAMHIATAIPRGLGRRLEPQRSDPARGDGQPAGGSRRTGGTPLCAAEHRDAVWGHRISSCG